MLQSKLDIGVVTQISEVSSTDVCSLGIVSINVVRWLDLQKNCHKAVAIVLQDIAIYSKSAKFAGQTRFCHFQI